MITYCISPFNTTWTVHSGDKFILSVKNRKTGEMETVCTREITCTERISCWAYVNVPGIGAAYFIGNETLAEFIAERFPDAIEENLHKST